MEEPDAAAIVVTGVDDNTKATVDTGVDDNTKATYESRTISRSSSDECTFPPPTVDQSNGNHGDVPNENTDLAKDLDTVSSPHDNMSSTSRAVCSGELEPAATQRNSVQFEGDAAVDDESAISKMTKTSSEQGELSMEANKSLSSINHKKEMRKQQQASRAASNSKERQGKLGKIKGAAAEFDVQNYFLRKILSSQFVSMYTHLLAEYKTNSTRVNNHVLAMFARLQPVFLF